MTSFLRLLQVFSVAAGTIQVSCLKVVINRTSDAALLLRGSKKGQSDPYNSLASGPGIRHVHRSTDIGKRWSSGGVNVFVKHSNLFRRQVDGAKHHGAALSSTGWEQNSAAQTAEAAKRQSTLEASFTEFRGLIESREFPRDAFPVPGSLLGLIVLILCCPLFCIVTGTMGFGSSVQGCEAAGEVAEAETNHDTCIWKYDRGTLGLCIPCAWSGELTFDEAVSALTGRTGKIVLRIDKREFKLPNTQAAVDRIKAVQLGRKMPPFTFNHLPGKFPSKVAAIAFAGGGYKSMAAFWAILYHISKTQNILDLLKDQHIGAVSGGGWFFVALFYSRQIWESLTTGKNEDEFLRMFRSYFQDVRNELAKHSRPLSPVNLKALEAIFGNPRLKDVLASQGFPLFDQTMLECVNYFISSTNGWKLLNDALLHECSDTPNASLSCTCDLAHGILTNVTVGFNDNWLVDRASAYQILHKGKPVREAQLAATINARITPSKMTQTLTLCQKEQSFDVDILQETQLSLCCCWDILGITMWRRSKQVTVTKNDLERGSQQVLQRPRDISGPTSCYTSVFSAQFFASLMGAGGIKDFLEHVERKITLNSFYAMDAINEKGEEICPLRVVDGGPWDHTAIAMAVKGMQREKREGDLVAITLYSLESYENFHCLFTDYDNKGDRNGVAEPPYPRCFKGFPPSSCAKYGDYLEVLDCEVETVECPEFEIKGGHKIRLFQIFFMPGPMKLLPFKQESIEEYVTWCEQALKDLAQWVV